MRISKKQLERIIREARGWAPAQPYDHMSASNMLEMAQQHLYEPTQVVMEELVETVYENGDETLISDLFEEIEEYAQQFVKMIAEAKSMYRKQGGG